MNIMMIIAILTAYKKMHSKMDTVLKSVIIDVGSISGAHVHVVLYRSLRLIDN